MATQRSRSKRRVMCRYSNSDQSLRLQKFVWQPFREGLNCIWEKRMWQTWLPEIALALLVSYLLWRHHQRTLARRRGLHPERKWVCHGFDAATIRPRIQRLRQNPVAAARARPRRTPHHELFLASVRQTLAQMPYFRGAREDDGVTATHDIAERHA